MNNQITDVIFDLDGTLIDSAPSILACFAETLAAQGIAPVLPLTDALIGPPLRDTLCRLSGVKEEGRLEIMIENFKERYDFGGYKATVVFSGVDDMLRELRNAGMRLHIATNKRLRPTRLILSHLGWTDLFAAVYALDFRTPSFRSKSEMLSELVQAEGITRSLAVYVGDRRGDRTAAADNALGFVAAAWGYRDEEMLSDCDAESAAEPSLVRQRLRLGFHR